MRVIAVINQKGGVGKTTTSLNLSHALALSGKSVLMLDLDPQANLTTSLGIDNREQPGMDSILLDAAPLQDAKIEVTDRLYLVPAGERLGEMEFVSEGGAQRGYRLHEALQNLHGSYDFVVMDCPPSAGLLGMNTLLAAKELIIPVASDYLSMQGLSRLMAIIEHIEKTLHRRTKKWLVITRFQGRRRLALEVRDKLIEYFPGKVLQTPINETVALAESPSFGKSIFDYKRLSRGAQDYLALANDVINRKTCP